MSVFSNIYEKLEGEVLADRKAKKLNTFYIIKDLFYATIINSFKYKNLPDYLSQTPQLVEEMLFYSGMIAMFENDEGEIRIGRAMPNGHIMDNGLLSAATIILPNGKSYLRDMSDIELCFNNHDATNSLYLVQEYIDKACRALNAVDITLVRKQYGKIFNCKDEQTKKKLIEALKNSYDQELPFAVSMGDWYSNDIKDIPLTDDREENITGLWDIFIRYRNLFFTTFGINTVEISKTERLTLAEGSSNDEIVQYTVFGDMYERRKDWVERCNKHFGTKLELVINRGIDTTTMLELNNEEKIQLKNKIIAPYENTDNKVVDKNVVKETTKKEEEKE